MTKPPAAPTNVDTVVFALAALGGGEKPIHLEAIAVNRLVVSTKELRQPRPVGAAAFDTERVNGPEAVSPVEQLDVAGGVRRHESWLVDDAAEAVDRHRDMLILVGVDTDDEIGASKCDAGHDC